MAEKLLAFTLFVTIGWLLLVGMLSLQEKSLIVGLEHEVVPL